MDLKRAEVEKGDDADTTKILDSPARARVAGLGVAMAGPWSRRARWLAVLGALLAYLLLLSYIKKQYLQVHRLNLMLDIEKQADELLQNLELMDHHLLAKLERLEALHRL